MNRLKLSLATLACLAAASCGGGGSTADPRGTDPGPTAGAGTAVECTGSCATATTRLTVADVERVIAQGVAEARAQQANATFAVVDRVGNVLAVYRMGDRSTRRVHIATAVDASGNATIRAGLEGIRLPVNPAPLNGLNIDDQAAIAKAITGAYLSSEGNAFSSRTASQIVQQHFNPGEEFQPGGPLFGVQFSQLACSDFTRAFDGVGPSVGPHRSPLGLSADPGGFPLYKGGTVVGGVGVIADGLYSIDPVITDVDRGVDEMIAYAATFGFAAPIDRRADRITADGKTLRFSDVEFTDLRTDPANAPPFASLGASVGALVATRGYAAALVREGTAFGQPASGIRPDGNVDFPNLDAFVFVDAANNNRYRARAGTDGAALGGTAPLSQPEVLQALRSALDVANRARAQIRRPVSTPARVTISVVDSTGAILGMVRTRDAPVFGADVSLQKARSAAFFSSAAAAAFLSGLPNASYISTSDSAGLVPGASVPLAGYVTALRSFIGDPNALADGRIAWSDRGIGSVARPFYPDGIVGPTAGPLSKPAGQWSVFSSGLQLDLSINAILQHVLFVAGAAPADVGAGCAGVAFNTATLTFSRVPNTGFRLANGLQIFAGAVPLYRGATLVGAIGISGDGIDQDDMTAFLGAHNAASAVAGSAGNAPRDRRSDTLVPREARVRYVQCPQAPFIDSSDQNVCDGK
jgi:uncharacterized protein GlcG (DUF336 family)